MHFRLLSKPNSLQPPCLHCFLVVGTGASGLTATPRALGSMATVAGLLCDSSPPAPTSYWKTPAGSAELPSLFTVVT